MHFWRSALRPVRQDVSEMAKPDGGKFGRQGADALYEHVRLGDGIGAGRRWGVIAPESKSNSWEQILRAVT